MNRSSIALALFLALFVGIPTFAQEPVRKKPVASKIKKSKSDTKSKTKSRTDKKADKSKSTKNDSKTKKSSSSHTNRLVVKNGKTIVDEETGEPKPLPPGVNLPELPDCKIDLDELMREVKEGAKSSKKSSSKRVVSKNGKKIVDEEKTSGGDKKKDERNSGKKGERSIASDLEDSLRKMRRRTKSKSKSSKK